MSPRSARDLRLALVASSLVAAGMVLASYDGRFDSVHFYSSDWDSKAKVDFGRVPQVVEVPGWTNELRRGSEAFGAYPPGGYDEWDRARNDADFQLLRARNLEAEGRYKASLRAYTRSSADPSFTRDRSDLFREVGFAPVKGLKEYLRATYMLAEGDQRGQKSAARRLATLRCAPAVEPHLAYARAAASSCGGGPTDSERYFDVYRRFPHSSRAEPALIMAARSLLRGHCQRVSASDVRAARHEIQLLLTRSPATRFKEDALGWLIRCDWLEGHEAKALAAYKLRAEQGMTPSIRWMAYESIEEICRADRQWAKEIRFLLLQRRVPDTIVHQTWTGKELRKRFTEITPSDARQLQKEIRSDPKLLESYIAFRIEDTSLDRRQEVSLLRFATSSLTAMRSPSPALLERVAQIAYNNGSYRTARRYALQSLDRGAEGEARGRARYVLAASMARLGRYAEAIAGYRRLAKSDAPAYLIQCGKEHLALLEERHGDPLQALRIYAGLHYDWDAAYLADAELSPRKLARYIDLYARASERPALLYTLGMRYFRQSEFSLAASTFERLSKRQRMRFGVAPTDLADVMQSVTGFDSLPKQRDVLVSVRKLWRLDRTAQGARARLAQAKALYSMAAYMYRERSLLFYSPGLWKGSRAFAITLFWSPQVNSRADDRTLERYCHEHETLSHVVRLCRDVEALHIRGPAVAQALYTEGLAADHLSNLNEYWRVQPRLKERAVNAMRRLVKLYPHNPLAAPAAKYAQVFQAEEKPDYSG